LRRSPRAGGRGAHPGRIKTRYVVRLSTRYAIHRASPPIPARQDRRSDLATHGHRSQDSTSLDKPRLRFYEPMRTARTGRHGAGRSRLSSCYGLCASRIAALPSGENISTAPRSRVSVPQRSKRSRKTRTPRPEASSGIGIRQRVASIEREVGRQTRTVLADDDDDERWLCRRSRSSAPRDDAKATDRTRIDARCITAQTADPSIDDPIADRGEAMRSGFRRLYSA